MTNPIITKKLEEYREFKKFWNQPLVNFTGTKPTDEDFLSKALTEAYEAGKSDQLEGELDRVMQIRALAQKETAREILKVVDKMIGTIETSKSPANSSVLHNLTAIIFSTYPSLDRKDSSKKQMTDQRVRGDDGGKETLCIHGIGHGDNLHTCDGCCITEA